MHTILLSHKINVTACNINLEDDDGEYKRPGFHMMQDQYSKLILHDQGHIKFCHNNIVSLEVVRGVNKFYEIDRSGFSLANGTLSVSHLVCTIHIN